MYYDGATNHTAITAAQCEVKFTGFNYDKTTSGETLTAQCHWQQQLHAHVLETDSFSETRRVR